MREIELSKTAHTFMHEVLNPKRTRNGNAFIGFSNENPEYHQHMRVCAELEVAGYGTFHLRGTYTTFHLTKLGLNYLDCFAK